MRLFKFIACGVVFLAAFNVQAGCSDREYITYQNYDRYLDANPDVPDYQLRVIFSRRVGMSPDSLKNLYVRCLDRWTNASPKEVAAYRDKSIKEFVKDCSNRPKDDPICRSVR